VPSGEPTRSVVRQLGELLGAGDIVVDGGNSRWTDDQLHAKELGAKGIGYLDCGVSGGVWGLQNGYALMVGGSEENVATCMPIFEALKPAGEFGFVHAGPVGAGHYTKMVHNGIEYGMMQAFAEGLDILAHADSEALPAEHRLGLNLPDITEAWRRGSVVASWLLDLTAQALAKDPRLESFSGHVSDSGEGRWTVQAAVESAVAAPVLSAALFARFTSRDERRFAARVLSAQRKGFGGHLEPPQGATKA